MTEIVKQLNKLKLLERYRERLNTFYQPSLNLYLKNLSATTDKLVEIKIPEVTDKIERRILDILFRNTLMADILGSTEFEAILEAEKELRGGARVGVVQCIDGRVSILHQFGRAISVKEIAGSLLELSEYENTITDRRFTAILEQTADQGRELLEIVTTHTSLRHPDHRCGRITAGVVSDEFEGEVDSVVWQQAEIRADAIETKYNNILRSKEKTPQARVSIAAMIDTDSMGLILNFGQGNQFSTTDLTRELAQELEQELGQEVGEFASMRDRFADPISFIEYSKKVLRITDFLMKDKLASSDSLVQRYILENFPDLSGRQQQALFFTICRTIANQFVTGLALEQEFEHPYLEHSEDYIVVAPHGKALGGFDMRQSFGSVPANREEMLEQVKIKLSLLAKNNGEQPYLLFLSTPVNKVVLDNPESTLVAVEDAARAYFQLLLTDDEIREMVGKGSLVIVPVLIDEENRRPLQIRDYSIYLY